MSRTLGALFALFFAVATVVMVAPQTASAASCVRFSVTHFDATGNDNANTNGEWVRIKNYCSTTKSLAGWTIHDYGTKNTYKLSAGVRIASGATITLYTGVGSNTSSARHWGRATSQVWDNSGSEYAYLVSATGVLQSKFRSSSGGGSSVAPRSNCDPNYTGYCVPNVSYDLDCPDIGHVVYVVGSDPHGFDRDNDGIGCESYG